MNKITISAIAFGVFTASAWVMAETPAVPAMKADTAQAMPGMDMKGQMGQMDIHMAQMQAMHEKMMKAATPEERKAVMEEQREAMQECMGTMKPMAQGGGMMGGKDGGMPEDKKMTGDMGAHMKMMQKRMDMMQVMMQSMMDQQGMTGGSKGSDAAPKS